jgi:cobalt/nickel transport system permease protein
MHMPDGYLDPLTAGVTWVAMILYGFFAYRKASLSKNLEVVVGLAASIFIAQMLPGLSRGVLLSTWWVALLQR